MSMDNVKNFLFKQPKVKDVDEPHLSSSIDEVELERDRQLYEKFKRRYDPDGKLRFDKIEFRAGAKITGAFGVGQGYAMENGKTVAKGIRVHQGVDRAGGGMKEYTWGTIPDIVKVPFDFNRSKIYEYGNTSYGTLVCLYNDEFGFEMRIAHMNPDTKKRKANELGPMISWSYNRLNKKLEMLQGYVLGSAGSWGLSTGAHTHTEFKSLDEECEVLEQLLVEKHGIKVNTEYTIEEIKEDLKHASSKDLSNEDLLKLYLDLKKKKNIFFLNRYKCQYRDYDGTIKTRYASNLLFNGL